jgi:RNA polymerase sigma factor (sigma-70 family)
MSDHQRLEQEILSHLAAAYTLARWITGDGHDAEDVVQEAMLRAIQGLPGYRGGSSRAWVLTIVRNTAYTWLQRHRAQDLQPMSDDLPQPAHQELSPDAALLNDERRLALQAALGRLPPAYREALVLREVEGLSYQAIAEVVGVPIGTVMSRLSRAREQLAHIIGPPALVIGEPS